MPSKETTGAYERLGLACKNGEIRLKNKDVVSQILKLLDNVYKRDNFSLTFESWSTFIKLRKKDTDTVQAIRNITLISQKRTKTKSCEFVRTFSKISEFAN